MRACLSAVRNGAKHRARDFQKRRCPMKAIQGFTFSTVGAAAVGGLIGHEVGDT